MSLTNDLYSYEKERQETEEGRTTALNGIQVVSDLLDVPNNAAKNVLRQIILELERQLHQAYAAQARSGKLCDRQLRYARSMIESLPRNLFFSSTLARYARAVPGSRLATK
ncbi:hypothetical protein RU639_003294 [Aspergillus parasiticus]